ncbi:hypothetical protein QTP88_017773 [Uroleucon formosanum]
MGSSANAGLVFKIKRLTRQYGSQSNGSLVAIRHLLVNWNQDRLASSPSEPKWLRPMYTTVLLEMIVCADVSFYFVVVAGSWIRPTGDTTLMRVLTISIHLYTFDTRVHYPIGSGRAREEPDVVYRSVPVYTPDVRRQLNLTEQAAASMPHAHLPTIEMASPVEGSSTPATPRSPQTPLTYLSNYLYKINFLRLPTGRLNFNIHLLRVKTPMKQKERLLLAYRHTARRTTRGYFAVGCRTRTPGGHRATPAGVLVGPRRRREVHYNAQPTAFSRQYSRRSNRRMRWCSTAITMACSSLSGIRMRQAEDESGSQPLLEDQSHENAALVCGTGTCVRSAGTGSAWRLRFELEGL